MCWPQRQRSYPSLSIGNQDLIYLSFNLVQGTTLLHAAIATTLPALGAIFQAFPALCPCEPRPPRGEMQAVPCGTRFNNRLLGFPLAVFRSAQIYPGLYYRDRTFHKPNTPKKC